MGAAPVCGECGAPARSGFRFCGRCGARVAVGDGLRRSSWWTAGPDPSGDDHRGRRRSGRAAPALAAVAVIAVAAVVAVVGRSGPASVTAAGLADPGHTGALDGELDLGDEVVWRIDAAALGGPPEAEGATSRRPDGFVVATAEGAVAGWTAGSGPEPTWRVELPVHRHIPPAVGDDLVLISAEHSVWALDAATGALRWRTELFYDPASPAVRAGDVVVISTTAGGLEALDAATGAERWRLRGRDIDGPVTYRFDVGVAAGPSGTVVALGVDRSAGQLAVHVVDAATGGLLTRSEPVLRSSQHLIVGDLLVGGDQRSVFGIDLRTGAVAWHTVVSGSERFPQPLVEQGGAVLVASGADFIVLDVVTGEYLDAPVDDLAAPLTPSPPPPGPVVPNRPCPVAAGEGIVVAADGDDLEAFEARDGRRRWSHRPLSGTAGLPSVNGDRVLLTDRGGNLIVIDAETGLEQFVSVGGSDSLGGAVVTPNGASLVTGGGTDITLGGPQMSGYVRIIDATTGVPGWLRYLAGPIRQPPTAGAGGIVVGTATSQIQRLALDDGEVVWTVETDQPVTAPVALQGEAAVVATATTVMVLEADGSVRWQADLEVPVRRAVAVDGELVVTRGRHGEVVALDLATGTERWRTDLGIALTGPPLIAGDRVLVGSALGVEVLHRDDGRPERRLSTTTAVIDRVRATAGPVVACTADGTLVALGRRP